MTTTPPRPRPGELIEKLDVWKMELDIKINSLREAIQGGYIDDPRDVLEAVPQIDPPNLLALASEQVPTVDQPALAAVESLMVRGMELLDLVRGLAS